MSDAMTNREIEDVLTSIRRLVAQEGDRGGEARAGVPGKLVLTAAQRIEPANTPANTAANQPVNETADQAASEPTRDAMSASDASQADQANLHSDDVKPTRVRPASMGEDEAWPVPDFGKLEATIAELEAAVSESAGEFEGEGSSDVPDPSNVTKLYGRLSFKHRDAEAAGADPDTPKTEISHTEVNQSPVTETKPGEPAPSEAVEAKTGAAQEQETGAEASFELIDTEITAAEQVEEGVEDTLIAGATAASDDDVAVRDDSTSAENMTSGDAELIDEEVLRQLVAEIVRGELHGQLGERITLQVRKLVRAEIAKALDERKYL